jgi:hypothetical protein
VESKGSDGGRERYATLRTSALLLYFSLSLSLFGAVQSVALLFEALEPVTAL